MVEICDVSAIRRKAERDARLSSKIETMQLSKAATREVDGPLVGLFKKGVGASSAPAAPREDAYVFCEYLDGVHSLLCKGCDISVNRGEGSLESELVASRDLKESLRQLAGTGTTSPVLGGIGAVASIMARHQALKKLQEVGPKGKAKAA